MRRESAATNFARGRDVYKRQPEDLVADINQITLDSVDTSRIEYSKTQKYELPRILSNRIWSDTSTVSVTYGFENHVSKTFNVTRVSVINVPENASYKLNTEEFTSRVRGLAAEMDCLLYTSRCV